MYLLSISPFSKAFRKDLLWYFSSQKIDEGKIVTISIRNQSIKGLVLNCEEAKDKKAELRGLDFKIKKIIGISKNQILNSAFIQASNDTAHYFATGTGSILNYLLPKNFLEEYVKSDEENSLPLGKENGKFVVQLPDSERYSEYKSLIRGRFARNGSVFFCVPTNEDALVAKEKISKGIEQNTFVLTNDLSSKEFKKNWTEIINSTKSVLVICTPQYLFTPIKNIKLIIVERENSSAYKTRVRPYFDIRIFAENYAKYLGADFLLGDLMLRSETLQRFDEHHFFEYTPIKFRLLGTAKNLLIDMNKESNPNDNTFTTISYKLRDIIKNSISNNKKTFVLVSRKGLAPLVLCGDCGEIVKCRECSSPVALFGKDATKKENLFKCKHCNASRSAGELCKNCNSWRLLSLGIGTEKVLEDLEKMIPNAKTFILDKEKAKTPSQAKKIIEKFNAEPAGVLIGTEMALLYLGEEIDNVVIASIDALFSIPDYRIRERILNILLRSKIKARDNFIIQTRAADEKIFKETIEGNLSDFYREEFIQRKRFNYPPFSLMIKFKFAETTKAKIEKTIEETKKILEPHEILIYDSFVEKFKNNFFMNGLIKIPRKSWPDPGIIEKLKTLPPNVDIVIDADSAL